ncbi:MAG TPA: complex I subunit 1 family protein, partial [Anaerolineales bacterium]|nr:complex I subunit 1 family protein [Anaerolineales bacterium]
ADAVKLIFKEELTPGKADRILFFWAPVITMVPSIILAAAIPFGPQNVDLFGREISLVVADISVGVLYLMSIASIAVYGIVLAGWSSNNKYAMLGGLRSSAQMISYELSLGLMFVTAIILGNSMSLYGIVEAQKSGWFALVQPVGALIFLVVTLAEVNRAPFDMPEAEQELTAGYHSEYSGMKFALFFMAEYQKMIVISMIAATLFFGGYREFWFMREWFGGIFSVDRFWWLGPIYLLLKVIVLLFFMIWVRATWPRIRYDRLMDFGWKVLLPLSLAIAFITAAGVLLAQDVNPLFILSIPIVSGIAGIFTVVMIYRELRRKAYERA